MKTLIIVDFQYDFCNPNGTLYVPGAEEAEEAIVKHINSDEEIGEVVFTLDWHPINHCSFKINGGEWPTHCLQYSQGAGISQKIMNACLDQGIPVKFFLKGDLYNVEEYAAFIHSTHYPFSYLLQGVKQTAFVNQSGSSYIRFENKEIEVCGLAGDYCVRETIDAINGKKPIEKLSVFMDGIKSIDGGKTFNEFLNEHPEIKKV